MGKRKKALLELWRVCIVSPLPLEIIHSTQIVVSEKKRDGCGSFRRQNGEKGSDREAETA